MKIVAIILALFVAFPNMGYALANNCCSHEEIVQLDCEDQSPSDSDHDDDHEPCSSQCECACCISAFLITSKIDTDDYKNSTSFVRTSPLNSGIPFAIGVYDLIWQPPQNC